MQWLRGLIHAPISCNKAFKINFLVKICYAISCFYWMAWWKGLLWFFLWKWALSEKWMIRRRTVLLVGHKHYLLKLAIWFCCIWIRCSIRGIDCIWCNSDKNAKVMWIEMSLCNVRGTCMITSYTSLDCIHRNRSLHCGLTRILVFAWIIQRALKQSKGKNSCSLLTYF